MGTRILAIGARERTHEPKVRPSGPFEILTTIFSVMKAEKLFYQTISPEEGVEQRGKRSLSKRSLKILRIGTRGVTQE